MTEFHNQMKAQLECPIKQLQFEMGVVPIQKYAIILRNVFMVKFSYE
jgi:hypothetical protein